MQKYTNNTQDNNGNAQAGDQILVTNAATGVAAVIYSDNGITTTTNPLTADVNGMFSFYAANGRYTITASNSSGGSRTISDIVLFDPADSGSAAIVGATDGAAGSLWTTVQGFINKIISSVGSSVVGFIQSGIGSVATTVQNELRQTVRVTQFMTAAEIVDVQTRTASIDVTAKIQAAIDSTTGPLKITIPIGRCKITSTIYLRRNGVRIVGQGPAVSEILFVNAAGGICFSGDTNTINSTAQYESCGLIGFEVLSSGSPATDASIVVDLTSFSYGTFDIEAQTRRANACIYYGQGNAGIAPYYNRIASTGLFGHTDYTQTAFRFRPGAWSGGSNGPNANIIGPITRAASLAMLVDMQSGQGNLFSGISGESISSAYFMLGGLAAVQTGTSSGVNSGITLNDTTKTWTVNAYINGAIQITGGTGSGQIRTIKTNTATAVTTNEPWSVIPDATSTYSIFENKVSKNKFVNIRAEGLSGSNPNFIYANQGSDGSEFMHMSVESLGSGKHVIDNTGSVKNSFYGPQKVTFNYVFTTPAALANINAWPRAGLFGGIRPAGDYVIEWVKAEIDGTAHGGSATITLDAGGVAVGGGSQTLTITIPNGESQGAALPLGTQKTSHIGTNESLFLNLQTDAAWLAARSVSVTVCVTLL